MSEGSSVESSDESAGVVARGVTRRFGAVEALRGLDLTAPRGRVTGLVGPNGAGKTTLLLILATLLTPDSGHVRVDGLDPMRDADAVRGRLGWMPDTFGVYDQLTVREYLRFFAAAYSVPKNDAGARITELLTQVHLTEYGDLGVHVLSRGQKQRLALARALVHRPSVLLLDEPASGLDPRSRIELRDLLRGLAAQDVAVLVSSHILTELEEIADRIVFVDRGRTVSEQAMADIARDEPRPWRVRALDPELLRAALDRRGVTAGAITPDGTALPPLSEADAAALLAGLVSEQVPVVSFAPIGSHLETAYLAMTEERR
ncbi:MAG: ABC transporter ATP-binding protein [Mycobacteriaceae bacterium]|nr:ABC transporter ATP-binding protein [Mycobacteriaceae bacterium]